MERARFPARKAIRGGVARAGTEPARARPQRKPINVAVSLRRAREVVECFKADGPGWQTRIDQALRKAAGL